MLVRSRLSESDAARIAAGEFQAHRWSERLANVSVDTCLTPRWYPLVPHPEQARLVHSPARFKIIAGGRRSGKTERAKRWLVREAIGTQRFDNGLYVAAAPTLKQAKRIYWEDLQKLVPADLRDRTRGRNGISRSELTIFLVNGARLVVIGMNNYDAIEGESLDAVILDEFAKMKPEAWTQTIRPMLSGIGRPGKAWFVGRPLGKNHFYELVTKHGLPEERSEWDYFHWRSSDILDPGEVAQAREDLDELSYMQEYDAEFVNFEGRTYYPFDRRVHATHRIEYDPNRPLALCFDFNASPGTCAYVQEQYREPGWFEAAIVGGREHRADANFTAVIGEVWIERNSTTDAVCRRIAEDWGPGGKIAEHTGPIELYGDATGGAPGSAKVRGSDWDIIKEDLGRVFRGRIADRVPKGNPEEVVRVNSVNRRLRSASGTARLFVDPVRAPQSAQDFEDVTNLKGGAREIDKKSQPLRTHLSDGIGYYIWRKYPAQGAPGISFQEVA